MKLSNLISIADRSINIMVTGMKNDDRAIGFDFVNNQWLDNNLYSKDRAITIEEFIHTKLYSELKGHKLCDFSTFRASTMKAFEGVDMYRDSILVVKVLLNDSVAAYKKAQRVKAAKSSGWYRPNNAKKLS